MALCMGPNVQDQLTVVGEGVDVSHHNILNNSLYTHAHKPVKAVKALMHVYHSH